MTPLLVALWFVVALIALVTVCGARRWHRNVTAWVRPGRTEPASEGYLLLNLRNWVVLLVAGGIVLVVTLDHVRLSEEELEKATDLGADLAAGPGIGMPQVVAETSVLLDRDLEYAVVTDEVDPEGDDGTDWYEIRPASEPGDDGGRGPVVCVELYEESADVSAGSCAA